MINQAEAADYLLHDIPGLDTTLKTAKSSPSIYQLVQAFLQLTCHKVKEHNYRAAKHCFQLADKLYEQGNAIVRCAIENVFVFSLDKVFIQADEPVRVRSLVPGSLYSAYIRQVMQHGC